MNGNTHVLPDSRMRDPKGTVMVEVRDPTKPPKWTLRNGRLIRLPQGTVKMELEPIYCINCGAPKGYVPRGIMSWVAFLCDPCSEVHGAYAAILPKSDDQFWADVRAELRRAYGSDLNLTMERLNQIVETQGLTRELQLLQRDSPYKM